MSLLCSIPLAAQLACTPLVKLFSLTLSALRIH